MGEFTIKLAELNPDITGRDKFLNEETAKLVHDFARGTGKLSASDFVEKMTSLAEDKYEFFIICNGIATELTPMKDAFKSKITQIVNNLKDNDNELKNR